MNRIRKSVFSILIVLFVLLISVTPALALVEKTEDFYVADYAEVLSENTRNEIISQNELLYEQTGGQIVVVTVRYLEDGYYADEYAVKLFNEWGVGDETKNNGILLLLVTEEGKAWLSQGSGIEDELTNDDIDNMLEDYFWKKFDSGDYDGAVEKLFSELLEWYEDTYNFTLGDGSYIDTGSDYVYPSEPSNTAGTVSRAFKFIFKVIIFIIIIAVIVALNSGGPVRRTRRRRSYWAPPPPPPPGMGHRPSGRPHSGFHSSGFRTGSGFRSSSSGGGRSSGFSGGGRSGGFRGGGGGRSGGGGGGRR